jgi:hypothetical protein
MICVGADWSTMLRLECGSIQLEGKTFLYRLALFVESVSAKGEADCALEAWSHRWASSSSDKLSFGEGVSSAKGTEKAQSAAMLVE